MRSDEWPAWFSFLVFWVLAGACQRHGVGGFLLCNTTTTTTTTTRCAFPQSRLVGDFACRVLRKGKERIKGEGRRRWGWEGRRPIHARASSNSSITQQKPTHPVPLASARQHPGNQKENQAGPSPERTSARWRAQEGRPALGSQPEGRGLRGIHARAGRAARRNAPPHPPCSTARATSHPPRRLAGRPERERPNKSEHSHTHSHVHSHSERAGVVCRYCFLSNITAVRCWRVLAKSERRGRMYRRPIHTSANSPIRS